MLRFLAVFTLFLLMSAPLMAETASSPLPTLSKEVKKVEEPKEEPKKADAEKPPAAVSHLQKDAAPEKVDAPTAGDDPYTIHGIKVDVSAETSMKARDKAFTDGQRQAFEAIAKNITGNDSYSAATVDDIKIAKLVKSFEVESERASGTRYAAVLTYHFKPQKTAALLGKDGAEISDDPYNKPKKGPVAETPDAMPNLPKTLILPILRTANRSILWEEKTDWHKAWDNVLSDHPAPDVVIPEGNMEDVGSITAAEALAGLTIPLMRIMNRYQAKGVIIAVLMAGADVPQPNQNLSIQLARFDERAKMLGTTTLPLYAQATRKQMEWLQNAASTTMATWRDLASKQTTQTAAANNGIMQPAMMTNQQPLLRVTLTVPFANMEEWSARREALQQIPGVTTLETVRMNRTRAVVQMDYSGQQSQLDQAFNERGMQILPTIPADGTYMLVAPTQQQAAPIPAGQPVFRTVYPTVATPPQYPDQGQMPQGQLPQGQLQQGQPPQVQTWPYQSSPTMQQAPAQDEQQPQQDQPPSDDQQDNTIHLD